MSGDLILNTNHKTSVNSNLKHHNQRVLSKPSLFTTGIYYEGVSLIKHFNTFKRNNNPCISVHEVHSNGTKMARI